MNKLLIIITTAILILISGCSNNQAIYKEADNNRFVFVKNNIGFRIELKANPTTGYNWYMDQLDDQLFTIVESGYNSPIEKNKVGVGGVNYWVVKPLQKGTSQIRMKYYRPWEGDKSIVKTFNLKVDVLP